MRRFLALTGAALLLSACAPLEPRPAPLTQHDVVQRVKSGVNSQAIIDELKRTETVMLLSASDIVRLHQAGVPAEVLDYLQRAQIEEISWRSRSAHRYDPFYGGLFPCPWPPHYSPRFGRRYAPWPGC
ncbi:MAG: hypothetical protein ACREUO_12305 [Burkholderiales bacterium]